MALAGLLCAADRVDAQPAEDGLAALRRAEAALQSLIERTEPAVVAITHEAHRRPEAASPLFGRAGDDFLNDLRTLPAAAGDAPPSGAGVVIDPEGLILTQYLTVAIDQRHFVTTIDGRRLTAEIRAADPRSGLAVLALTDAGAAPLPAIKLGEAENLRKGSSVLAIGNPQAIISDGQPTASHGSITNLAAKADDRVNLNNARDELRGNYRTTLHHFGTLIQTDARLGWNASGGALVDLNGELVGITTTVSVIPGHEQPAGYAIPINEAFRRVIEVLKQGKEVEYGLLGISFNVNTPAATTGGRSGITVENAYPGGPAARAGLRSRDIITKVGGEATPTADRLQLLVGQQPPGSELRVAYERNGSPSEATVRLSKHFTIGEKIVTNPPPRWRGIQVDYATAISQAALEQASRQGLIDPAGCVVVTAVSPESVSWKQGVREGMFISHVGGERVTTPAEFWRVVEQAEESVKLRFTRPTGEL